MSITRNPFKKLLLPLLLIFLIAPFAHAEQRYFYDSLGRLTAETDANGNPIFYEYDAVGNLLSIRQGDPLVLSLFSFLPLKGPVGTKVTLLGSGFSTVLSENQVFFNGTPAVILSSTKASLVVTVPNGATTGSVKVTTPRGTVQSRQPFTVIDAPVVTSIDPNRVAQGTVILATIYGQNLPSSAEVTFSHPSVTGHIVNQGGGTQLGMRITIATNAPVGSYTFSLTTPNGVIQSGSVTVTVMPPAPAFSTSRPVSIFVPPPATIAPSGPVITSTPGPSVFLPPPTTVAPSGSSMTAAPPESVSMP